MNYLAHALLAGANPESLLGNLMGDFVRGSALEGYPDGIRHGIRMHRRIDVFTDAHPVVLRSKERIRPPQRRYAGIAVDLFYDHFLARRWADYSPSPLAEFTTRVYDLLREREALLPERMRPVMLRMAAEDWLGSYAEVEGICRIVTRVGRRFRAANTLAATAADLEAEYAGFEEDFRVFFPELMVFAGSF